MSNNEKVYQMLRGVLCDPEGKCCIQGSDEDRRIVDKALSLLKQPCPECDEAAFVKILRETAKSQRDLFPNKWRGCEGAAIYDEAAEIIERQRLIIQKLELDQVLKEAGNGD